MAKVGYTDTVYGNAENLSNSAEGNLNASADAIVAGGNTGLGIETLNSQQISLQQQQARDNLQKIKDNNMSAFDHTMRGISKTAFAIMDYPMDVFTNVVNNALGYTSGELDNRDWNQLTPEEQDAERKRRADIFWGGTQIGQMANATADYVSGVSKSLDTGSDWFLTQDSQTYKNVLQRQKDIAGWDTINEYGDRATVGNVLAHQALHLERGSLAENTWSTIGDLSVIAMALGAGGKGLNMLSRGVDISEKIVKGASGTFTAAREAAKISGAARTAEGEINTLTATKQLENVKAQIASRFGQSVVDDLNDMADEATKAVRGTDKESDTVWTELQRYGDFLHNVQKTEGADLRATALGEATQIHTASETQKIEKFNQVIDQNERGKLASEMSFYTKERDKTEAIKANDLMIQQIEAKVKELQDSRIAENADGTPLDGSAIEKNKALDEQIANFTNVRNRYLENRQIIKAAQIGEVPTVDTLHKLAGDISGTIVDERILPIEPVQNSINAAAENVNKWKAAHTAAKDEVKIAKREYASVSKKIDTTDFKSIKENNNKIRSEIIAKKKKLSDTKFLLKPEIGFKRATSSVKNIEYRISKLENEIKSLESKIVNEVTHNGKVVKLDEAIKLQRGSSKIVKDAEAKLARAEAKLKDAASRVEAHTANHKVQTVRLSERIANNERLTAARAATNSTVKEANLYRDLNTMQGLNLAARDSVQAQAIAKAQNIAREYNIPGIENVDTYDKAVAFLRDVQGLRVGANGEVAVNVEAALNFATRGGIKHIVEAIIKINKADHSQAASRLFNLTRGKLDIETVKLLSNVADGENASKEIMAILMEAMTGSRVGFDLGKLSLLKRGARVYSQDGHLIPLENLAKASASTGSGFDRLIIWGYERKMTNTPWSYNFDTRDTGSMVNALNDMIEFTVGTFGIPTGAVRNLKIAKNHILEKHLGMKPTFVGVDGASWRSFKNKYVTRMINAKNANERKLIFEEAQLEMAKLSGENAGLHLVKTGEMRKLKDGTEVAETQLDVFVDAFKRSRAARNGMIKRMARIQVESKVKNVKEAIKETGVADEIPDSAILYGEFLNFTVGMINPYEMRKMINTGKTMDELYNTKGLTITVNGVERKLSVGSVRKAVNTLITDMYDRLFRRAMLFRVGYVARNIIETQIRMYLNGHPNTLTNPLLWFSLDGVRNADKETLNIIQRSLDNAQLDARGIPFIEQLAEDGIIRSEYEMNELQKIHNRGSMIDTGAWNDPNTAIKLGYEYSSPGDADYAEGIATHLYRMASNELNRDVLAATQGKPLRDEIWSWAKLNGFDKGHTYEMIVTEYYWSGPGNAKLVELMQANKGKYASMFDSKAKVSAYLFGSSNISVKQMWNAFTDNFDTRIVDEVLSGNLAKGKYRDNIKNLKEITKDLVSKASKNPSEAVIQKVPTPKYFNKVGEVVENKQISIVDMFELASNNMFKFSAWGEKTFATLPEFRYAYWDYMAKAIISLSPEEAAKVVETASKTLSTVTSSWARDTLKSIKANAKNAGGTGVIKIDDLHETASSVAGRKVGELFYDANKRNAVGHALRFISPFGQAWANSMLVWGKLAMQNVGQVYRAETVLKSLETPGSDWIYDPLNLEDSNKPFIYKDPATGKKVFGIPLVGEIGGLLSGQGLQSYGATMDVGSLNLIMQNGFAPGFGPVVQIAENIMSSNDIYRRLMPDELRTMINPYSKDPNAEFNVLSSVSPAWFQELFAQVLFPDKRNKYTTGAMLTLLQNNPEKYLDNNGVLSASGQLQLAKDSLAVSNGLSLARGLTQFFAIGSTKLEAKFKDTNGSYFLASTVSDEFFGYLKQGYDQKEAMGLLTDKYGAEAALTMISANRLGYTPTDDAWELSKSNPDLFAHYSSVMPLIYPGGGYSTQLANYMSTGTNKLDVNEQALQVNKLLRSAQEAELDRKLVKGTIAPSDYQKGLDNISKAYTGAPVPAVTTSYRDSVMKDLTDAMTDPTLAQTKVGQALKIYMDNRNYVTNLGVGIDSKKQAGNREKLFEIGTQLAAQYPEFAVVWFKVLRSEVKPQVVK